MNEEERLVGLSIQVLPAQREALRSIARGRQLSVADVVREAVRLYLAELSRQEEPVAA